MSEQNDKSRELVKQILDRIDSDPDFRQELVNNPTQALNDLGLGGQSAGNDVSGYLMCTETCKDSCLKTCNPGGTCAGTD